MSKVAERILSALGSPTHCGEVLKVRQVEIDADQSPKTLEAELYCSYCGDVVHKAVAARPYSQWRELLDNGTWQADTIHDVPAPSNFQGSDAGVKFSVDDMEENGEVETEAGTEDEDGMYYCEECGHNHRRDSGVGQEHLEYAAE